MAKRVRPSNSYPPEFLVLAQHVMNTGEAITIDTLGAARAKYTTFRARWNEWRAAVAKELGEDHPLVQDLQSLTITVVPDISEGPQPAGTKAYAVMRRKDEKISEGLRAIADRLKASMPQPPVEVKGQEQDKPKDSEAAKKVISSLFGGDDE